MKYEGAGACMAERCKQSAPVPPASEAETCYKFGTNDSHFVMGDANGPLCLISFQLDSNIAICVGETIAQSHI